MVNYRDTDVYSMSMGDTEVEGVDILLVLLFKCHNKTLWVYHYIPFTDLVIDLR